MKHPRPGKSGYAFKREGSDWDLVVWTPPKGCKFVGYTTIDGARCAMWTTKKGDTYARVHLG